MPRYYFHVCNGTGFVEDEEGRDCADDAEARAVALDSARDLMSADLRAGELDLTSFIEVEDEARRLLFTLAFADAVAIKAQHDGGKAVERERREE